MNINFTAFKIIKTYYAYLQPLFVNERSYCLGFVYQTDDDEFIFESMGVCDYTEIIAFKSLKDLKNFFKESGTIELDEKILNIFLNLQDCDYHEKFLS